MARKITNNQRLTLDRLLRDPGPNGRKPSSNRQAWEGKTLLLGVTYEAQPGHVPVTRMWRIDAAGQAVGV